MRLFFPEDVNGHIVNPSFDTSTISRARMGTCDADGCVCPVNYYWFSPSRGCIPVEPTEPEEPEEPVTGCDDVTCPG